MEAIEGVGPEVAGAVERFLRDERNRRVLRELRKAGVRPEALRAGRRGGPLEGRVVVFTGSLGRFTRSEAREIAESLGARVASSVSGETDFVVAGGSPGGKLAEAERRGVKVLDEEEFAKQVERAGG